MSLAKMQKKKTWVPRLVVVALWCLVVMPEQGLAAKHKYKQGEKIIIWANKGMDILMSGTRSRHVTRSHWEE